MLSPLSPAAACGIVTHPVWLKARAALLDAASAGPTTLALLGEAGTGKSWLLRHLDVILRETGQAVTLVGQGDLPWTLQPGAVLLIDEAARMNAEALAILAAQRTSLVILADLPAFADILMQHAPPPRIVRLTPLGPEQVGAFVSGWLTLAGRDPGAVSPDGIDRLIVHSNGTPRLIGRLLKAAFAFARPAAPVDGVTIDELAELRWNADPPAAEAAAPSPPVRARRRSWARWAPAAAIAAAAFLSLRAGEPTPPDLAASPKEAPTRDIQAAALPAMVFATAAPVAVAAVITPEPAREQAPTVALTLPPPSSAPAAIAPPPPPAPSLVPVSAPRAISPTPPDVAIVAAPSVAPALELTATRPSHWEAIPEPDDAPPEQPGLVLIARRGDTLRDLYASLYRGVQPPPFEEVVAANPKPVVPGAVVVFPAPAGGWPHP